ncbi:DUF3822 family protein [Pontibacter amylolyticus]|uniref:DUF3822 family protein n=1 Tax=Pontibacter amylolyticus TaxID=1424080 RepID=A0ABQ1W4I9_9BACT|nr:DUF3822 family protein [Pontibacter amylolyticus]GGG14247.1 hypothetical protein GCM10011323_18370 [Pontibacter amylolyticus]
MNTINTHFRLSYQLQDEAFQLSQAGNCNLYIALSSKAMRLAVADVERNKFVALEDYELITVFTPLQIAEQLRLIADQSPILQEQRWLDIRVSVSNQFFTLVPETLFDPAHQEDYLRLHSTLDPQQHVILHNRTFGLDAVNIFAVDGVLYRMVQSFFPERTVQFTHQTSALIKSLLLQTDRKAGRTMHLYVERNYVTVLVIDENGLQFCNVFHYLSPEDFIYFVVFVMQEQKMNPEQETITAWGDITPDSSLFNMLKKYIRQVKFGKRPTDVGYSYKFDDLFDHRYFELFSLHFCE